MIYFAMGFTTYIIIAAIHGLGDPDPMDIPLLVITIALWIIYFLYLN